MKVFDSGRLIEDFQRTIADTDCDCRRCLLRSLCNKHLNETYIVLCLENKEVFKQDVIDHYSNDIEEVKEVEE